MSSPNELHTLAGPYALDALDPDERQVFARHLDGCATCAAEVAELRETAARLADDTWSVPPPRLREQVLAGIRRTRQVPPARPVRDRPGASARRWWRHPAALVTAACVLAAALVGGTWAVQEQRLRDERAAARQAQERAATIESVLTAPDATVRQAAVAGGGRVTVVASPTRDAAVVLLAGAHDPGAGHAYQFWLMRDGKPRSAGWLAAGQTQATQLVEGVRGADLLGVTVEPAGGSDSPTLPIIAQVPMV
ncbi:anti-sigma factor [Catellatospora tritici]|uniref:anti-sigma factor n=1 Tax=Catellatospora tritici TaxID=2851566 RepID=UPI001C2D29ED|nr:anti-sigma factor [Catellatospora tritici]MBV1854490.1 anti-sigma factor [Catellatospora tritici]